MINKNNDKKKNIIDIFSEIKKNSNRKFIESIDVAINLMIDIKKSDNLIKNYVILPYGIKKNIKIVVFASDEYKEVAYSYGAYFVGKDDLFKKIISYKIDFDLVVAMPDTIKIVSKLGKILGPKGLMPNINFGTITSNIKETVKNLYEGKQIIYKNDRYGIVHVTIGKTSFSEKMLLYNLKSLVLSIKKNKPNSISSIFFIKKITISSTMGKGFIVNDFNF